MFRHVSSMGLEGIVSKRTDAPYRSGPSKMWLKSKNPASDAAVRTPETRLMSALGQSGHVQRTSRCPLSAKSGRRERFA